MPDEIDRIKAEAEREVASIKESGGHLQFVFSYLKYLNELRSPENQTAVALEGRKFKKRPVQLAAIAAVTEVSSLRSQADDENMSDEEFAHLKKASRMAYSSAAGHFDEEQYANLPEPGEDASSRRQSAADDWDRLIESNPNKLMFITLFGHEPGIGSSMSKIEIIKGIGSLIFLAALAIGAYYVLSRR